MDSKETPTIYLSDADLEPVQRTNAEEMMTVLVQRFAGRMWTASVLVSILASLSLVVKERLAKFRTTNHSASASLVL
jgi:hypothetical protein